MWRARHKPLATGATGHYVAILPLGREDDGRKMNGSVVQLIGFVVLAAIILAVGFGALGTAGGL